MLISATSLGIGSCWVDSVVLFLESEHGEEWKRKLDIPDGYKPIHTVSLGYSALENVQAPPRKVNAVNYIK